MHESSVCSPPANADSNNGHAAVHDQDRPPVPPPCKTGWSVPCDPSDGHQHGPDDKNRYQRAEPECGKDAHAGSCSFFEPTISTTFPGRAFLHPPRTAIRLSRARTSWRTGTLPDVRRVGGHLEGEVAEILRRSTGCDGRFNGRHSARNWPGSSWPALSRLGALSSERCMKVSTMERDTLLTK